MSNTNMDNKKNPNATTPILEFTLPKNECDVDAQTGDHGEIRLKVEIIAETPDSFTFRKKDKAVAEGNFRPEGAKEMRERLIDKQDGEKE